MERFKFFVYADGETLEEARANLVSSGILGPNSEKVGSYSKGWINPKGRVFNCLPPPEGFEVFCEYGESQDDIPSHYFLAVPKNSGYSESDFNQGNQYPKESLESRGQQEWKPATAKMDRRRGPW